MQDNTVNGIGQVVSGNKPLQIALEPNNILFLILGVFGAFFFAQIAATLVLK